MAKYRESNQWVADHFLPQASEFNQKNIIETKPNSKILIDQENIDMELLGADKPAVMRLGDYLYLALPLC